MRRGVALCLVPSGFLVINNPFMGRFTNTGMKNEVFYGSDGNGERDEGHSSETLIGELGASG